MELHPLILIVFMLGFVCFSVDRYRAWKKDGEPINLLAILIFLGLVIWAFVELKVQMKEITLHGF